MSNINICMSCSFQLFQQVGTQRNEINDGNDNHCYNDDIHNDMITGDLNLHPDVIIIPINEINELPSHYTRFLFI